MLQKLQFRPGINREGTTLANEGGWFECDKIRFRSGFPEKLGGWERDTGTYYSDNGISAVPPSGGSYWGVCRSMWNWVSLSGNNYLALGTNLKYYIQNGVDGLFYDITPLRNPAGTTITGTAFTTVNASTTVTVNANAHGAQTGDFVTISGVVGAVNGIPATSLNKEFQITYLNSNQYNIAVNSPATSSGGPTGTATFTYQITSGLETYTVATGWGAGAWGGSVSGSAATTLNGGIDNAVTSIVLTSAASFATSGTIVIDTESITYSGKSTNTLTGCVRGANGSAAAAHLTNAVVTQVTTSGAGAWTGWGLGVSSGGIGQQLRLWSQSNYGEDLIFNPRGGPLYYWAVSSNPNVFVRGEVMAAGTTVGGVVLDASCPSIANFVTVSDASRFVIAFGTNFPNIPLLATQDPMLIRWSDQENYGTWIPAVTNQAGDYRLSHGSVIVTAQQARQEILVWTDSAIYSMQYLGPPYVWGFQIMGDNISIAGPNVTMTANNVTYWMGTDKFYMYSGRVETLPCALRQYVYEDINMEQSYQFFAGTNEGYNEIWWFYCSAGSNTVDKYVVFNHLERTWYYGTMARTYWLDSPLRTVPIAAGYNGQLIYHETGNDDGTTIPASPIVSYCQSSDFDIGDGHNFGLVTRIIPDVTFDGSNVASPTVTFGVRPRQAPGANYGASNNPDVVSVDNYSDPNQRYYDVQQFTQYVYVRVRGRQMAFRVGSDDLGTAWQLGTPRLDVRPDGRR
jgi:hypothetical protein